MESLRRLYRWVLSWAEKPGGTWALFAISLAEASFFPIPPDPLLLLLCLGRPRRSLWFAAVCSAGSVLGGALGYLIGAQFFAFLGQPIIDLYGLADKYEELRLVFEQNNFLAIFVAGLTPIPYKVFTIAAGTFQVHFLVFLLASVLSRSLRFFAQGVLVLLVGDRVKEFMDRWFEWLAVAFVILLILGFVLIRWLV